MKDGRMFLLDNKLSDIIKKILTILQSCLICLLIVCVAFMMFQIDKLQGTAKVVNYAGLVRGATQRLVKLEMAQKPNDDLIAYLDDILSGLKYEEGSFELVSLDDENYQEKLDALMLYWGDLKEQIVLVRTNDENSADRQELLEKSEVYFRLADDTVFAAEIYSDKIAKKIQLIEVVSAVDMSILSVILLVQTFSAMRIRRKNIVLEQKAYVDVQTGLKNKNMCLELIENMEVVEEVTACIVFDMNNLKRINDSFGHLAGDQLIENFAKALKRVAEEGDFAGRYGGDEFLLVLYGERVPMLKQTVAKLQEEVDAFNRLEKNLKISYAYGWAVSTDYENCTFKMLFKEADHQMYINKRSRAKKTEVPKKEEVGESKV